MKKSKKVVLLGGSGFVGRNITEQLSQKHHIYSPTHKELNLVDFKSTKEYFKKIQPEIVIHAVNIGGTRKDPSPPNMLHDNLSMFFNVVRCEGYFKKMIFLGSGAEYDKSQSISDVKESDFDQRVPQDDYGLYKYICSKYIEQSTKIISLRIFGLYGKHEDYELRFISNAICRKLFNLPIEIHQNVKFDYVYINDFIRIIDHFMTQPTNHSFYNIGTNQHISLLDLAKKINALSSPIQKITVKKPGLGKDYTCDASLLAKELGNFKFTSLTDSLAELFTWYNANQKDISKEKLVS